MTVPARQLVPRPGYEREPQSTDAIGEIKRTLTPFQKIMKFAVFRQTLILIGIALIWQVYAVSINNELMLPSFTSTLDALWTAVVHGPLLERTLYSFEILVMGYVIGVLLAGVLVSASVSTQFGNDLLALLTAMFNPLPAIALLPLALLWFGIGAPSIVFVIVHSVLWAVALNTHTGFRSVSETTRMAGQSFGLTGLRYILGILVPAAFPSILSGLKIGWAFAWRTLIAAELVFGATSRSGGLGWFIFENRNSLETPAVFAGLLTVIILGLFVEGVIFAAIERRSVRRWGMQR
ncbi:ABC transporter permease [Bradyrhizobium cenepequi]